MRDVCSRASPLALATLQRDAAESIVASREHQMVAPCSLALSSARSNRRTFNMHGFRFFRLSAWAIGLALALAACSTTHGPAPSGNFEAPARLSQAQADDITIYAIGLVGTPYRYGGNTPAAGFDCSGLIGHVYQTRAGVAPPRTVVMLKDWGHPVSGANIRTGDLVLFTQGEVLAHAGIYVGNGRFVHAPSTGGEVRLDDLNSKYWKTQKVAFRRP